MIQELLLCRRCGVLLSLLPEHVSDGAMGSDAADPDLEEFRTRHAAHGLEHAFRDAESAVYDRPASDPMATAWFQVTTADGPLVVRSWRPSLEAPRQAEVRSPLPELGSPLVDVDERLLRRALDRHFFPGALQPTKIEGFVRAVRTVLAEVDPTRVDVCYEDTDLANTGIGPLPGDLCDRLLARCAAIFDPWEIQQLRQFVGEHRSEYGALALRVQRHQAAAAL